MPMRKAAGVMLSVGLLAGVVTAGMMTGVPQAVAQFVAAPADPLWSVPEIGALPDNDESRQIRRGRDLITATYAHIGPAVTDESKRYAGNNLACSNCHLNAGTKKFGLPLWGLWDLFPQYSKRSGTEISIEDRINSCMTRSMNGKVLPDNSPEMQAFVAYIKFLSTGVKQGEILSGLGAGKMPELKRAADPVRGRHVYSRACAQCHMPTGLGLRRNKDVPQMGYLVPPLWGPDSFNDGAGMARLTNAANFIHFNMPNGTSYNEPRLSQKDAWDVAAYIISQPRPQKSNLDKDFPDLLKKPIDTPYGPYADGFSQKQHQFGPYGPIKAAIARLKAKQSEADKNN